MQGREEERGLDEIDEPQHVDRHGRDRGGPSSRLFDYSSAVFSCDNTTHDLSRGSCNQQCLTLCIMCALFLLGQVSEATTSVEVEVAVIPPFPFLVPVKDQVCMLQEAIKYLQG